MKRHLLPIAAGTLALASCTPAVTVPIIADRLDVEHVEHVEHVEPVVAIGSPASITQPEGFVLPRGELFHVDLDGGSVIAPRCVYEDSTECVWFSFDSEVAVVHGREVGNGPEVLAVAPYEHLSLATPEQVAQALG